MPTYHQRQYWLIAKWEKLPSKLICVLEKNCLKKFSETGSLIRRVSMIQSSNTQIACWINNAALIWIPTMHCLQEWTSEHEVILLCVQDRPCLFYHTKAWWRMYASFNWANIGPGNGLAPVWRQAINWANDDLLLIRPLCTNFGEIGIKISWFSFKKMHLKILPERWQPFC